MPVAEIAAGAAAVTAEGGSTAAAAGVGAGGAAAGTGGGATAGGAAAGEGTAASGATAGGVSSYKAGQTGAVAAAKSGKVDASVAEAQSRAGRGNSAINLQNFSFGKKKNKDDNEKDDNLVSNENAMKLVIAFPVAITVSGIVSIILIVNMLVTFIYTGPLAITYPSFENSTENTAGYTNGDDVAKKLVKYYEQDYFKIWALNPDEVDYLHDYSNLRDVMMVYSMLIQTDKQKTDVPSYVSDLEDTEEGSLISKFFKAEINALKSMISFVKWIFVTRQQINLLKSVYKEMFYWKVHYKVTKHGIKCKINIYNKTVDDYIDDHPELTEDQKNVLSVAKDSQYEWGDWDSSEYDAIAYQGGGSGNVSYSGAAYGNGGNGVYYIDSNGMPSGYGSKKIPSSRQEMVNKVAQVAIANYKKSGILPSVAVAQACYESSWGESNIARTKKNLFGIKYKGQFLSFKSWEDSMDYYFSSKLILKSIYDKGRHKNTPEETIRGIIEGGYCQGDGNYVSNIISIINTYGFTYFDDIAKGNVEATAAGVETVFKWCAQMVEKKAKYSKPLRQSYGKSGGKKLYFDCSSFCWYAYKTINIDISGTSSYPGDSRSECSYLKSHGCSISRADLQPGDLVFYKHHGSSVINHVDMYAGNGMKYNCGSNVAEYKKFTAKDAVAFMRPLKLRKAAKKKASLDSIFYLCDYDEGNKLCA